MTAVRNPVGALSAGNQHKVGALRGAAAHADKWAPLMNNSRHQDPSGFKDGRPAK